jgi:carbon starvation protein
MLAAIALTVCTVVLFKMKRERFALVTLAPAIWLVVCTITAGLEKVFHPNPNIGFIGHAFKYGDAIAAGQLLAPAKSIAEMRRIVFNDYVDAMLAAAFVLVVIATVGYAVKSIWRALNNPQPTAIEAGFVGAVAGGRHA